MISAYKEKIIKDIRKIPDEKMPKLYKIIHLFISEVTLKEKKISKRGSLKGIWKGSHIDESVFIEAKKSIFPYEYN
jgi:mRNA-degrading endonuclease YafQ of YafQ-DinJ toxin-antitoxin module